MDEEGTAEEEMRTALKDYREAVEGVREAYRLPLHDDGSMTTVAPWRVAHETLTARRVIALVPKLLAEIERLRGE